MFISNKLRANNTRVVLSFLAFLGRCILRLRYRVELKGTGCLAPEEWDGKKGVLFFSNHVSLLDGLIFMAWFGLAFKVRPIGAGGFLFFRFVVSFFKLLGGMIILPTFYLSVNQHKIRRLEEIMDQVAEGVNAGASFLLFPAGMMKNSAKESLAGSSLAHSLFQKMPEPNVVFIRMVGLWGSSFSKAQTGTTPPLSRQLWCSIKKNLKNGIFFAPRRKVEIEFARAPAHLSKMASRTQFNQCLENWYNYFPNGEEPLQLVPEYFWSRKLPEIRARSKTRAFSLHPRPISKEIISKVTEEMRRILNSPTLEMTPEMDLAADLGMDSLDRADLMVYLTRNFDTEDWDSPLETVQDALEMAAGAHRVLEATGAISSSLTWPEESGRPDPMLPTGKTVPESFFYIADRMGPFSAFGDDISGVLSYRKVKQAVLILAEYFRTVPESRIGVLLPASASAFITILAMQTAGKVPVMLNWTLGSRYLDAMVALSEVQRVVTSSRFVDRLSHVDFDNLIDRLQFLEDIRAQVGFRYKLRGAFLARRKAAVIIRRLKLDLVSENETSVILFTSGSESVPKGVPLSHKNVLGSIRSSYQCVENILKGLCFYSTLPPYHTTGFVITGLSPLLSGLKIAFYPDPTDLSGLAAGIEQWKVTGLALPPSFLSRLCTIATVEQLQTVRVFWSGAEKVRDELWQRLAALGCKAQFLEGYGLTEATAIVATHRPKEPRKGVGRLVPSFEACTIHPDTQELVPEGDEGELCLFGPNLFQGYLGKVRSPFIEIGGKKWYRTGDMGRVDREGFLYISGRLKRFAKIGGEMISLGAIEEVLYQELINAEDHSDFSLAVCADERDGNASLVLFTTAHIEKEIVNLILKEKGFSNLVKITSMKVMDELPLTVLGKLNYRLLQDFLSPCSKANNPSSPRAYQTVGNGYPD